MNDLREFVVVLLGCISGHAIFWYIIRPWIESCLSSAKAEPDKEDEINKRRYTELIMAVKRKFPDESRHETALRYIQEAERNCIGGPSQDKDNP